MSGRKYKDGQKTSPTPPPSASPRRQNNLKWLSGELSREDRQWLQAHLDDVAVCCAEILGYVDEFTQISVKWDTTSNKFLASMLNRDNHPDAPNTALSTRASTPSLALFALWFVFTQRYDGSLATSVEGDVDDLF